MTPGALPPPDGLRCDDPRLRPGSVGIRRVEVDETGAVPVLTVTLVPADALDLAPWLRQRGGYALSGGVRLHPRIAGVEPLAARLDQVRLALDGPADLSRYELTLTGPDADPFLRRTEVTFRLHCARQYDCRPTPEPDAPPDAVPVQIDYLAKDYGGFRAALLDLLAVRMPSWTERSEADVGIALLELLAATGDGLSYLQDRVAAEAFLGTATQRRSVAHHLALLGYRLDDGAAAETWLQFRVAERRLLPAGFQVMPAADEPELVFETLAGRLLEPEQNEAPLYDWGNAGCTLTREATAAVLVGSLGVLQEGWLAFVDVRRGVRDVVRLVAAPEQRPADPDAGTPALTVVRWSAATPLSADYPVADTVARGNLVPAVHGRTVREQVDVAGRSTTPASTRALVVPAEGPPGTEFRLTAYGFAPGEPLVIELDSPDGVQSRTVEQSAAGGLDGEPVAVPGGGTAGIWTATVRGLESQAEAVARWRVGAAPHGTDGAPGRLRIPLAERPLASIARPARPPVARVAVAVDGVAWTAVPSLLGSGPDDLVYRVELDADGAALVEFGNGGGPLEPGHARAFGRRPPKGSSVTLTYRVGGGSVGNVGADTLTVVVQHDPSWLIAVTNPLPASGGRDPESLEHARRAGPAQSRNREVAVTAADFESVATDLVDDDGQQLLSRAGASFRWTGSFLTASVTVDPVGGRPLDRDLEARLRRHLERSRLAGYDLRLRAAEHVPLRLELDVTITPGALTAAAEQDLRRALGSGLLPDGTPAFFHPDRFSFGDPVRVSRLLAAATAVAGVQAVRLVTLAPLHSAAVERVTSAARASGLLAVGPDQIVRLDDDPNFPEHGQLVITTRAA